MPILTGGTRSRWRTDGGSGISPSRRALRRSSQRHWAHARRRPDGRFRRPEMTHRIGVGIHGAGNVSTEYIRAFMRNPDTEVRIITSRTLDSARRRAAACGVDCDVGDDFEAMLRRDDVQIVAICTPNHLHTAEGIQAARAGKHFVIEKPIALSLSELRDLLVAV